MTRKILLCGDNLTTAVKDMNGYFRAQGVELEAFFAPTAEAAASTIQEWREKLEEPVIVAVPLIYGKKFLDAMFQGKEPQAQIFAHLLPGEIERGNLYDFELRNVRLAYCAPIICDQSEFWALSGEGVPPLTSDFRLYLNYRHNMNILITEPVLEEDAARLTLG